MRTHLPGPLHEMRSTARFQLRGEAKHRFVVRYKFSTHSKEKEQYGETIRTRSGRARPRSEGELVNGREMSFPAHAVRGQNECKLVAEAAERRDPPPEFPAVRPDEQGVQLRERVQEP